MRAEIIYSIIQVLQLYIHFWVYVQIMGFHNASASDLVCMDRSYSEHAS